MQQARQQGTGGDAAPTRRGGAARWWGTAIGTALVLSVAALAVWFATGAERVVGAPVVGWAAGPTAQELVVTVQSGGCLHDERVAVRETADRVEVSGSARMPGGDVACTADIRYVPVTVRLARPLDERVVVTPDGAEVPEDGATTG